jgi:hypothetical protein
MDTISNGLSSYLYIIIVSCSLAIKTLNIYSVFFAFTPETIFLPASNRGSVIFLVTFTFPQGKLSSAHLLCSEMYVNQ